MDHYRQLLLTDTFRKYDYGLEKNVALYKREIPPEIDLKSFTSFPIAMFCGITDKIASPLNYSWLRDVLASNKNCIYYKEYDIGHAAFIMPNDQDRRYFVEMLELCKHYNKLYEPIPVKGYDLPWQQEILA